MQVAAKATAEDPAATLSKAVRRAAGLLGFSQAAMADILGLSASSVSRLYAGNYCIQPERRKEWELALLFVRLFRSLDAILGHGEQARSWLKGENLALGGKPVELVRNTEGLVRVVHYLDAYRGRI
ncbi:MAG TPA: MbcA/ParS/Xre antitoxin family protein [Burkholderiales bacterium]|nr:MbcA/ParS/Xre antitoxin family protein [Burkholderiales bacterium]